MLVVKVKDGEKIDRALKRLKRKFRDTKVLQEVRDRKEHKKDSFARREQLKRAQFKQHIKDKQDF
jgi:small subunit ribosomal protein S21